MKKDREPMIEEFLEKCSKKTKEEIKIGKISNKIYKSMSVLLVQRGDSFQSEKQPLITHFRFPDTFPFVDSDDFRKPMHHIRISVEYNEDKSLITPEAYAIRFLDDARHEFKKIVTIKEDKLEGPDGREINSLSELGNARKLIENIVKAAYKHLPIPPPPPILMVSRPLLRLELIKSNYRISNLLASILSNVKSERRNIKNSRSSIQSLVLLRAQRRALTDSVSKPYPFILLRAETAALLTCSAVLLLSRCRTSR